MIARLLLLLAFCFSAAAAFGQTAKELVGSWTLISVTVNRDGEKIEPFGPNPKGTMTFDSGGRFSIIVTRSDLPKFASNNRETGTSEENKAVAQGSIAYFGTYSVDEDGHMFIVHVGASSYPNFVGTDQKRIFTITGDELKYTNSNWSAGAGVALVVWKRAK
jgi:lipocalin-like protein